LVSAGDTHTSIMKEFRDIEVAKSMKITLRPQHSKTLINGIELIAQP